MSDDELTPEQRLQEEKWNREFGPDHDIGKRRLMGFLAIASFIGIVLWVIATAPN